MKKIRKSEEVNTASTRGTTGSHHTTATIQKILGTMRRKETDQKEAASLRVGKKNDQVIKKKKSHKKREKHEKRKRSESLEEHEVRCGKHRKREQEILREIIVLL